MWEILVLTWRKHSSVRQYLLQQVISSPHLLSASNMSSALKEYHLVRQTSFEDEPKDTLEEQTEGTMSRNSFNEFF